MVTERANCVGHTFSFLQPSGLATRWSATGVHDDSQFISFAIHNQSRAPAAYLVRVYDSTGGLVGQGVTPQIPGANGVDKVGGSRGFLVTDVVAGPLPVGVLKVEIEGAAPMSAMFLQFTGDSATSLPSIQDIAP